MQLTGTEKSILRFFYNFMSNDRLATKAFELNMSFKDLLCDWPRFMDCLCLKRENLWHSYNWQCNFLPLSSQKFLVLILLTSDGLKAESTLEPPLHIYRLIMPQTFTLKEKVGFGKGFCFLVCMYIFSFKQIIFRQCTDCFL